MLFNSVEFLIFLPVVFILYWFVLNKSKLLQNSLLLLASYIFYGWWDWRFLFLIFFSTVVDYTVGLRLSKATKINTRKILLALSIFVNIGLLVVFKYFNFFIDSLNNLFELVGLNFNTTTLRIILPVGISFYTFQTLSYTIDIYRKKLSPTTDFVAFAAFVGFFPQLVAGPIERASNLLPQFKINRTFSFIKAKDGLRQILWGLFKKIVIADNAAYYVNLIFENSENYSGSTLLLGAFFFAFQIYGDFSGYSDIAIGVARLFGFNLMKNFAFPYFSRDIAEFWRRWHISLSTWFRDYVYIPLGGSHGNLLKKVRNTFIIFIISGFWHGANWTFIFWGFLNALLFLPLILRNKNRLYLDIVAKNRIFPTLVEFIQIISTFILTMFIWVFFRADSIGEAFKYIKSIFSSSLFTMPELPNLLMAKMTFLIIILFIFIEWLGRNKEYALAGIGLKTYRSIRWSLYYCIIFLIFFFWGDTQEFIYFQF